MFTYQTPCIDTTEELGRRSGDMSFTEFIKFQNRVRVILWQEKNRKEMLNGGIGLKTTIAPLKRTMYLTYPNLSEGIDLVVVAESNGYASYIIFIKFLFSSLLLVGFDFSFFHVHEFKIHILTLINRL